MKNKLILLVSMLLPLISGCGEKPTPEPTVEPTVEPTPDTTIEPTPEILYNYKESKYSHFFNEYEFPGSPEFGNSVNFTELENKLEKFYILDINTVSEDYYLCGYMPIDAIEIINNSGGNQPFGNSFAGIESLYLKYQCCYFDSAESKEKLSPYPLKWYEIPKTEDIPTQIDNMKLIMISSVYYASYYSFIDNKLYRTIPFFVEESILPYYDGKILSQQTVKYGYNAQKPEINPKRKGYVFQDWSSTAYYNVKSDVTITAKYTREKYIVQFVDENGNEYIDTMYIEKNMIKTTNAIKWLSENYPETTILAVADQPYPTETFGTMAFNTTIKTAEDHYTAIYNFAKSATDGLANVKLVNVGGAFLKGIQDGLKLYGTEGNYISHPNVDGTYIVASMLYSAITGEKATSAIVPDAVNAELAPKLQEICDSFSFESGPIL